MFIGHWAPALAAATMRNAPPLGTLFVAGQLVDIGFMTLTIVGIEHARIVPGMTVMNPLDLYHMPWTHSLAGTVVWAAAFGVIVGYFCGHRRAGWIAAGVVLSHWFLDLLVHRPDLTLFGSPPKLGLGLWNHPWIAMPLELALVIGGWWLMARRRRHPKLSPLAALLLLLLGLQMFNWFGPQPRAGDSPAPLLALAAYGLCAAAAWWAERATRASGLAGIAPAR